MARANQIAMIRSRNVTSAASTTPATSVTPAKRKFYKDSVATIFVGKSKRPFYVHLDLLCDASPVFKAEFAGKSKEATEKKMQLPDDHESTFELFADWLYYQRYEMLPRKKDAYKEFEDQLYEILSRDEDDSKDDQEADAEEGVKKGNGNEDEDEKQNDDEVDDDDGSKDEKRYMQAFRLFVFADKYDVCKLKSKVIKTLLEDFRGPEDSLPISTVTYAYKHTAQGSGLRRLLADFQVWVDLEWFENPEVQTYLRQQSDFAVDMNISFAKKYQGKLARTRNPFKGTTPEEYKDKSPGQEKGHSYARQESFLMD